MACTAITSFAVCLLLGLAHLLIAGTTSLFTWPNATVFYQFDHEFTVGDKEQVQYAIEIIESKTCIQFHQIEKPSSNQGFISLKRSEDDCVNADICYQNGARQVALFGPGCLRWPKIVHGLLLNLCLRHENTRSDRDEWISYDKCSKVPPKGNWDLRGHMYDYTSGVHDNCRGCPNGKGSPMRDEVFVCGEDVTKGISVLDAEKLNDYYNCEGCHRHKWRSDPSAEEMKDAFHLEIYDEEHIYICRAYYEGQIIVGKYNFKTNRCHIPWFMFNKEVVMKENFQIMMVTNHNNGDYHELDVTMENFPYFVAIGRTRCGVTTYAALAEFKDKRGHTVKSVGVVHANDFSTALVTDNGETKEVSKFTVLGCRPLVVGPVIEVE